MRSYLRDRGTKWVRKEKTSREEKISEMLECYWKETIESLERGRHATDSVFFSHSLSFFVASFGKDS